MPKPEVYWSDWIDGVRVAYRRVGRYDYLEAYRGALDWPTHQLVVGRAEDGPLPWALMEDAVSEFLKAIKAAKASAGQRANYADEELASAFPSCAQAMTMLYQEGGKWVNRFSLSAFLAEGVFKVSLRDKQEGVVLFLTLESFADLWKGLEEALNDPEADWRLDRFAGHGEASRRRNGK